MKSSVIISLILSFILGFSAVVQFRSVSIKDAAEEDIVSSEALLYESIQMELETQKAINSELNTRIAQYIGTIDELQSQASDVDGYTKILSDKLKQTELAAGFTEVAGPGIVITVTDKQTDTSAFSNGVNLYVVHQEDLLKIINELCDADAEAISINGERLIATSEVRCAGATVSVNNRRYSAPFVIKAIGNPENLSGALNMRDGVVDSLSDWLDINIEKKESVTVPAYLGTVSFNYAKPVASEEDNQ